MEQSLKNIRLGWWLVRGITSLGTFFTFLILATLIPTQLEILRIPAIIMGMILSALVIIKCNVLWARIALISQLALFSVPLLSSLFLQVPGVLPALILAFVMILLSDHTANLVSKYQRQFSTMDEKVILDFNWPILGRSFKFLYRRLALNGAVFAVCYLVTIGALLSGLDFSGFAPILSDVSLYILVISISLALLVTMKED